MNGAMDNSGTDNNDTLGLERPRKDLPAIARKRRIKILSCGDAGTGKSCLIKRLCEKRFVSKYLSTIGIDFGVTNTKINKELVKVNFFDTSGHPSFEDVRTEFYNGSQGIMLVFDVTSRQSFQNLEQWLNDIRAEVSKLDDSVVVVVCGNKIDKTPRAVHKGEASLWAATRGLSYFETSAQSGENVSTMFDKMFEAVVATCRNGGVVEKPERPNFGEAQLREIERMLKARDNYDRLELEATCTKDDINRSYKRFAALLHPDKNRAPGADEAFKVLGAARTALLGSRR